MRLALLHIHDINLPIAFMDGIETYHPAVWTPSWMQIAATVDVAVDFGNIELSDILYLLIRQTHDLPAPVEAFASEIAVSRNEIAIRRIQTVSVEMHFRTSNLMGTPLFAHGELHMRIDLVLKLARDGHGGGILHGEGRLPVEMRRSPAVREAAAEAGAVGIARKGRGVPIDALELLDSLH